ncbi:MAG: T9SS type A sorting domain-containing protein, partial [Bacteroidia bacterium]
GGENAFGDLYGKGRDLSTNMATAEIQFTTSQDFYFHYNSNTALPMVGGWMVPTTNSATRNGSGDMTTIADHYYVDNINFPTTSFNIAIGVNEQVASFGSVNLFPNPANELVNVNINLVQAENVAITMFNAMGQAVLFENRDMAAGATNVQFNTSNLASGVYFVNVAAGNATTTTKIVVE